MPGDFLGFRNAHQRLKTVCRFLGYGMALTCLPVAASQNEGQGTSSDAMHLLAVPEAVRLEGKDSRQQLLISAPQPDGRVDDLTRDARYKSLDLGVATVGTDGVVLPVSTGRTQIEISAGLFRTTIPVEVVQGDQFLPIVFAKDIVPILTKAGCNGGGCHGKSDGRGGFALSLFGYDPGADYDAIVKGSRGRRIFPAWPEESLLLRKPIGSVPHAGGKRLSASDPEYSRLLRWIAEGVSSHSQTESGLLRIDVEPKFRALRPRQRQQVIVTAVYRDGSTRDVTRTAEFRSNEPAVALVDDHGLVTAADRIGDTAIVCLYAGQAGVARMMVPQSLPDSKQEWADFPRTNLIDDHVLTKLRQLKVQPSPLVDDAGFLRRATVQIAGRIPTLAETQSFLGDRAPDKRTRLIDRLARSGESADHFAQKWSDILRIKRRKQKDRESGTLAFHRWIRNAIASNQPYDQIVRAIITASGNPSIHPPAQWYAEVRYLDRYVDDTAEVFLGVRIGCARCHNHPFETLSQDDYYGLAAFFARVGRKGGLGIEERRANEVIFVQPSGEVRHPVTGRVVAPHGLNAPPVEVPPYADPRSHLVDWMTTPDNPYFARAYVNRMWAHFFGRGLVEPLDDIRATNPASNEPLLDALADAFIKSGFDMRRVVSLIGTSTTYQLSAFPSDNNLDETQSYSRFYPQRLAAEVLLDAVDSVTGARTEYRGLPSGTKATQLPDEDSGNAFLSLFGRPPRESACECERIAQPSLTQSLFLMNDRFILDKVASKGGLAERLAKDPRSLDDRVEELFLTTFSRPPTGEELEKARSYLQSSPSPSEGFQNLVWVLLNTKEFLYTH
ncbi:DUF1549 and DUF1553 domain-containing protein [Singulisphaera sp. Ch08]|uniref:DUF1549 and DUF1553 domain-containing protein n=1 Tax=Singulisphaera sp. Ch08 TaxID=3120278 RepID=A0AAU7CDQ0_9BACT